MQYSTIQSIFDSGVTNMTQLRNNSRQDDGVDTVTGVDWFKFRGNVATNLYASGNSWVSIGTNNESNSLKVNRRDSAMWNLWREEGTIRTSENKFLRIRWDGYTQYNSQADVYHLTFDMLLLSNNDIVLNIVTWPTSNNTGTYQLMSSPAVSYVASATDLQFTFLHGDTDGNVYTVQNGIVDNLPSAQYLIGDVNGNVYTIDVVNDEYVRRTLSGVTTATLTASNFQNDGFFFTPPSSIITGITSPKIFAWFNDNLPTFTAVVEATPYPQPIVTQIDFDHIYITGISSVSAVYTLGTGDILVSYSYDDITYTTDVTISNFLQMDFSTVYAGLTATKQLYIKFTISGDAKLNSFQLNYTRRPFTP